MTHHPRTTPAPVPDAQQAWDGVVQLGKEVGLAASLLDKVTDTLGRLESRLLLLEAREEMRRFDEARRTRIVITREVADARD